VDGEYTFDTALADGTHYVVAVYTQPTAPNQTCVFDSANDTGDISGDAVTDVDLTCTTNQYTVGGTVDHLTGTGLTLQINGGGDLPVSGSGDGVPFTFAAPLDDETAYTVSVSVDPTGQTCSFGEGSQSGTISGANVDSVHLVCSP